MAKLFYQWRQSIGIRLLASAVAPKNDERLKVCVRDAALDDFIAQKRNIICAVKDRYQPVHDHSTCESAWLFGLWSVSKSIACHTSATAGVVLS
ncbi:hypothetical protein DFP92_103114 [Yoonia sediminilitoris]|uniref:Uncharacterized protein n=1 Tax=Yoonia sediminilitoris TaxID=1286148 RepID=A0A2T6KJW2_9RHOB|nr:hypothetical protein C8N45_103114 [Yoonia sediminilitoris]RCW96609.1 hypothetical protein DFP92_103114 [Yoonia sediminilitoris]